MEVARHVGVTVPFETAPTPATSKLCATRSRKGATELAYALLWPSSLQEEGDSACLARAPVAPKVLASYYNENVKSFGALDSREAKFASDNSVGKEVSDRVGKVRRAGKVHGCGGEWHNVCQKLGCTVATFCHSAAVLRATDRSAH